MLNAKNQLQEKQTTESFIYDLLIENLKKQEQKLKPEHKAPKLSQHVMVSKSALDKFYEKYGVEFLHLFNSVEYTYSIKHEFYGFKCWKVWLERKDS